LGLSGGGSIVVASDDIFVVISGFCDIGESSFLGVNSTVINNINIGKDCFIGAGALIQKDVPSGSVLQESSTEISKVSSLRLFKIGDGQ